MNMKKKSYVPPPFASFVSHQLHKYLITVNPDDNEVLSNTFSPPLMYICDAGIHKPGYLCIFSRSHKLKYTCTGCAKTNSPFPVLLPLPFLCFLTHHQTYTCTDRDRVHHAWRCVVFRCLWIHCSYRTAGQTSMRGRI